MNDRITLQEGIVLFKKKNSKYFSKKRRSQEGDDFLNCHDVAHVVFGCDTTIYGEGIVKIWTTFGTNLSFWTVVKGYQEVSAFDLARKYSFRHVVKNIFRLLREIPKAIYRAKRMSKPWPFYAYDAYLETPIAEIREAFNIRVLAK